MSTSKTHTMRYQHGITPLLIAILQYFISNATAFLPLQRPATRIRRRTLQHQTCLPARSYGPPSNDAFEKPSPKDDDDHNAGQPFSLDVVKQEYEALLESVLAVSNPQHIPSLLAKNTELLLSLGGKQGSQVAQAILDESRSKGGDALVAKMEEAIDLTLVFAEDFVTQASRIDRQNKELLGKILRTISDKNAPSLEREERLDDLFEREKLTPGFLRHVEGECERISAAPEMTSESRRLLETLRVIQARVVEELGGDLGEAARVLGQLIGYETLAERMAVLEAGLTVRGVSFARDLKELTVEALDGFERIIASKPDPDLVEIVKEIDQSLQDYLDDNSTFE